jgi:hypothetical protein
MTGSGKTGLAIDLIEEALRQGIPVLAIDPKGDLANLLLLFDRLDPAQFAAWVDPETARRQGLTPEQAEPRPRRSGRRAWPRGGSPRPTWPISAPATRRSSTRRDRARACPWACSVPRGARRAPSMRRRKDLRDEIAGIVAGLLGLVGIEADPLRRAKPSCSARSSRRPGARARA